MYSGALHERVVVVLDPRRALPEHVRGYVAYGVEETRKLEGRDDAMLQRVHLVKSVFEGEVVAGPASPSPARGGAGGEARPNRAALMAQREQPQGRLWCWRWGGDLYRSSTWTVE